MLVARDVPLAPRTTLGLGGPARRLCAVMDLGDLREALDLAARAGERALVLGGGSNLVVGDAGWPGVVITLGRRDVVIARRGEHALVTAAAGVTWDDLVAQVVGEGLVGVEALSGIPGQVGATPIQNVGAYGQEVADTVASVAVYDREADELLDLPGADCGFGYRTSRFKGGDRYIVLEVTFRLGLGPLSAPLRYAELTRALGVPDGVRAPLAAVRDTVIALRRGKGMVVDPRDPDSRSAGSFFVNPVLDDAALAALKQRAPGVPCFPGAAGATKVSAAWLIEQAGFTKGFTQGNVGVSSKHALALINRGGASATELLALARTIQEGVVARFGVSLVPEPVIVT
jgi:UDP-N-acetylmuramate dehydrogenase